MATNNSPVSYLNRNFDGLRQELIDWAKKYHPDILQFFNDSSPDMMYLEMCAWIGDLLSYYTDKSFNESFLPTAQARESLIRIAHSLGFFTWGATPAQTQVTFNIKVPGIVVSGSFTPDPDLLISLRPGTLLQSDSGVYFEVLEEVNFADDFNRKVIPNLDGNNIVVDFNIEKTAVAKAGQSKIQRFYVSDDLAKPFLNIVLDDKEVTEIIGVVDVSGNVTTAPIDQDFTDPSKAFFEATWLTDESLFLETNPQPTVIPSYVSNIPPVVKVGEKAAISKRFITRRDISDFISLTFGSSVTNYNYFNTLLNTTLDPSKISYNQVLNNTVLGEIPPPNSSLFIKYRTGAGEKTNVLPGQINTVVGKQFFPSTTTNITGLTQVRNSLAIRNDIAALGGREIQNNEEVRQSAGKIFSAQDRAVTYNDIKTLIETMPTKFGRPFRISYEEIKPVVTNYVQVQNGVNTLLDELLLETTTVGRSLKVQEIKSFLTDLPNTPVTLTSSNTLTSLRTISTSTLTNAPSLWIGEKARLYILGIDENATLVTAYKDTNGIWVSPLELLKNNIKNYLQEKRLIGDWIDIVDMRVVNFVCEATILTDKKSKQSVAVEALNKLRDYFNINSWQANQPIFLSNTQTIIQEIQGVINVVDLKFYNIFGLGNDSLDPISSRVYSPFETGRYRNNSNIPVGPGNNKFEMLNTNGVIQAYPDTIFECRYPASDIVVKVL